MVANPICASEDLAIDRQDQSSIPTNDDLELEEPRSQKIITSLLTATLAAGPLAPIGDIDFCTMTPEQPTHVSLLNERIESVQNAIDPPRKISITEAIRLADANFQKVESAFKRETERDALGTAIWEE